MNIEDRIQMACEQIAMDEGFWGDVSNKVSESELEKYYKKAEDKATEIAKSTKDIEDGDEAWEIIADKLDAYKKEVLNSL